MNRFTKSFIEFIKRPDVHIAISSYDFNYVYERLKIEKVAVASDFTSMLYEAGINSLPYLKYIPTRYMSNGEIPVKSIILPKQITSIGDFAFVRCTELEHIDINEGCRAIYATAFGGCTSLKQIDIPSSVTTIWHNAFEHCSSLETVTFAPNSKLTLIYDEAFKNCTKLKEIELPEGLTQLGNDVFIRTPLKRIRLPQSLNVIGDDIVGVPYLPNLTVECYHDTEGEKWAQNNNCIVSYLD
jgi:hypothetical protein